MDSSVIGIMFIIKDKKKRAYEKIVASIRHGIITIDDYGNIINVSSRIPTILNIERKEILNKNFFNLGIFVDKRELRNIYVNFINIVKGFNNEFLNLSLTIRNINKKIYFLISCTKVKKIFGRGKYIFTLHDLTERTGLLNHILTIFKHENDPEENLIDTLFNIFKELGFERIRIYKAQDKSFIGLQYFGDPKLDCFQGKKFVYEKDSYIDTVINLGKAITSSIPLLKFRRWDYDSKVFEFLEIDENTEWLDLPIIDKENNKCSYIICLDKGKSKRLYLDQEIIQILDLLSPYLSTLFKNIEYFKTIKNEKKTIEELLTLHNRKSNLYFIIDELRKHDLFYNEWTIFLLDKRKNKLIPVSSSVPNFYEKNISISLENNNGVEYSTEILNTFKNNEIKSIKSDSEIIVTSCLSSLERGKIGVILIRTRDDKFIEWINSPIKKIVLQNHLNSCSIILDKMLKDEIYFNDETTELKELLHDLNIPLKQRFDRKILDLGFDEFALQKAVNDAQELMMNRTRIFEVSDLNNRLVAKFDFNNLILPLRLIVDYYARTKGIYVLYNSEVKEHTEFFINYDTLRLAIYQLLDNAVKYSTTLDEHNFRTDLPFGNITVNCFIRENNLEIEISNYGESYPADWEKDKFYCQRGNSNKVESVRGSGIGLQQASRLLNEINSELNVIKIFNPTTFKITVKK